MPIPACVVEMEDIRFVPDSAMVRMAELGQDRSRVTLPHFGRVARSHSGLDLDLRSVMRDAVPLPNLLAEAGCAGERRIGQIPGCLPHQCETAAIDGAKT